MGAYACFLGSCMVYMYVYVGLGIVMPPCMVYMYVYVGLGIVMPRMYMCC